MIALKIDLLGPGGKRRAASVADDGDVGEVSVLAGIVQAVAHDELVFDAEADVIDGDVDLPPRRLAEQAGGADVTRRTRLQDVLQVRQREASVDDVFDDQDVASFDGAIEILDQLNLSR